MDLDGDISDTYEGNGPAVSQNIAIPADFFDTYFSLQQVQQLSFDFTSGVPASGTTFNLTVGSTVVGPIVFSTNAATTANNIETALFNAGFTNATISVSGVRRATRIPSS